MTQQTKPKETHQARTLYFQGFRVAEIARKLKVAYNTVASWKRREAWDATPHIHRVDMAIETRLALLVAKPEKTKGDFTEMEALSNLMLKTARVKKIDAGEESPKSPKEKKTKGKKNTLTEEQVQQLVDAFESSIYPYQREWFEAKTHKTRFILKSRQIGATWYFAREALIDAITNLDQDGKGAHQIFLSASKNQAQIFKRYIIEFCRVVTGVELTGGDMIPLWNGAELRFLGTNYHTAQGYSGNVYVDESFWIRGFDDLNTVASAMATHKKWRITYFSTPSVLNHPAYGLWSGDEFNIGRHKDERIEIDLSHAALKDGVFCADKIWRQIVTIEDAERKGCELFDIENLRFRYSKDKFNMLFMCAFIDDSQSVFKFEELQACTVDSALAWADFKPHLRKPLGTLPVWVGFDPSRDGDTSSVVIVAPPTVTGGKFRIVKILSWKGMDFATQAEKIREITKTFHVVHLAVDASGLGLGVYELIKTFYPAAKKMMYSVELKTRLVLIAKQIIENRRLEFDAGRKDLIAAMMTIRPSASSSGKHITYQSNRSKDTGHADQAWALLNALEKEGIGFAEDLGTQKNNGFTEIF